MKKFSIALCSITPDILVLVNSSEGILNDGVAM